MKDRNLLLVTVATLVLVGGVVLIAHAQSSFPVRLDDPVESVSAAANTPGVESFRIPPFVIKDGGGPIGQVIYYDGAGPTILFEEGARRFPVIVIGPDRLHTQTTIGYTTTDCTGTEYLQEPDTAGGWWGLLGHTYAFRGTGATTDLFRVTQGETVETVTLQSRWSNSTDFCIGNGFSNPIEATAVTMNIDFPVSLE